MEYYSTKLIIYIDEISVHTEIDMIEIVDEDLFEFIQQNEIRSYCVCFASVDGIDEMISQYEKLVRKTQPRHIEFLSGEDEIKNEVDKLVRLGQLDSIEVPDHWKVLYPVRRLVQNDISKVPVGVTHLKCTYFKINLELKDVTTFETKSFGKVNPNNKVETLIISENKSDGTSILGPIYIDGSMFPCLKKLFVSSYCKQVYLKNDFPFLEHAQGVRVEGTSLPSIKTLHISKSIREKLKPYFDIYPTLEQIRFGHAQDTFVTHKRYKENTSLESLL